MNPESIISIFDPIMATVESFTLVSDHLIEFEADFNDLPSIQHTVHTLLVQKDELKTIWDEVKKSYSACIQHMTATPKVDSPSLAVVEGKYQGAYRAYVRCMAKISELVANSAETQALQSPGFFNAEENPLGGNIHLPPCDTEVFKGDYATWPS